MKGLEIVGKPALLAKVAGWPVQEDGDCVRKELEMVRAPLL